MGDRPCTSQSSQSAPTAFPIGNVLVGLRSEEAMYVLTLGQTVCLALASWTGCGSCYQVSIAQSTGYATLSGMILVAGFLGLAATRRFRA